MTLEELLKVIVQAKKDVKALEKSLSFRDNKSANEAYLIYRNLLMAQTYLQELIQEQSNAED